MAIDTNNEQLALMESEQVYEPALPLSPGEINLQAQRQFLWGYPFDITAEVVAAYERRHAEDVFLTPNYTWLYPTSMSAPEFAPFIRDLPVDTEDCFSRRPEREETCLRRPALDAQTLRRAPECPDQFACPNEGCV